jgi:hypothetical protein
VFSRVKLLENCLSVNFPEFPELFHSNFFDEKVIGSRVFHENCSRVLCKYCGKKLVSMKIQGKWVISQSFFGKTVENLQTGYLSFKDGCPQHPQFILTMLIWAMRNYF